MKKLILAVLAAGFTMGLGACGVSDCEGFCNKCLSGEAAELCVRESCTGNNCLAAYDDFIACADSNLNDICSETLSDFVIGSDDDEGPCYKEAQTYIKCQIKDDGDSY